MLDFSSIRLRRRTLLATAGLVLGAADRLWAAQTNQRASEAQALTDRILTESLAADPVTATGVGEHRYDGQWPDLSAAGLQREQRRVARAIEQLRVFDRTGLDAGSRVDLDTLSNQLELERFVTEAEAPERRSPLFYTGLIGSGIDDLLSRPFAATKVRATSVAERLEALPAFIDQARVNLRQGPILHPHAQVALQQADGLLTLVQSDILGRLPDAPPALARRIAAAAPAALAAIEKFRSLLKDEWLPKANGDWRLGRANFDRKLQLTLESELTASEVYDLATREHERVRSRMAELARELYAPLFGTAKVPASDDQVVRQVLAELASDCVAADELRSACESKLAQIATFVEARRLVPQDQSAVLQVIWTPPQKRGVALAGLDSPPPLDSDKPGLPSFYLVQPVPDN